jgi:hypothetical protein
MDGLWPAVGELGGTLGEAATTVASEAGPPLWQFLSDYPQARLLLCLGIAALALYWFADGVRNWRRKCLWCRGRGSFNSKLSKHLDRPCKCCSGSGRHTTVRRRITNRIRH